MGDKLWLVGKETPPDWEFFGVFTSYERALAECKGEDYFLAPIEVDVAETEEEKVFDFIEYPHKKLT